MDPNLYLRGFSSLFVGGLISSSYETIIRSSCVDKSRLTQFSYLRVYYDCWSDWVVVDMHEIAPELKHRWIWTVHRWPGDILHYIEIRDMMKFTPVFAYSS